MSTVNKKSLREEAERIKTPTRQGTCRPKVK